MPSTVYKKVILTVLRNRYRVPFALRIKLLRDTVAQGRQKKKQSPKGIGKAMETKQVVVISCNKCISSYVGFTTNLKGALRAVVIAQVWGSVIILGQTGHVAEEGLLCPSSDLGS